MEIRQTYFLLSISIVVMVMALFPANASAQLVVADFDSGESPNNVGGSFGSWHYDPTDETQGAWETIEPDDYTASTAGYCLRLDYDVQSPNPAFNGFWMKLRDIDVSNYNVFSLWVRGDRRGKYTKRFKIELKDALGRRAVYVVDNITSEWQEIKIPFRKTRAATDWTALNEFTVVFDDLFTTVKEGIIFIDQISFTTEADVEVTR